MSKREYYITYRVEYNAYNEHVYSTIQAGKVSLAYQLCGLSDGVALSPHLSRQQRNLYDALQSNFTTTITSLISAEYNKLVYAGQSPEYPLVYPAEVQPFPFRDMCCADYVIQPLFVR